MARALLHAIARPRARYRKPQTQSLPLLDALCFLLVRADSAALPVCVRKLRGYADGQAHIRPLRRLFTRAPSCHVRCAWPSRRVSIRQLMADGRLNSLSQVSPLCLANHTAAPLYRSDRVRAICLSWRRGCTPEWTTRSYVEDESAVATSPSGAITAGEVVPGGAKTPPPCRSVLLTKTSYARSMRNMW